MTDRELLELAAKAAGVCLHPADQLRHSYGNWGHDVTCTVCGNEPSAATWKPLTDDGDALRLAVKLSMYLNIYVGEPLNQTNVGALCHHLVSEQHNGDPCAATRRAIVRAAAEVGKAMP